MKYEVKYQQNGGEYCGIISIECNSFIQIGKNAFMVNSAIIELDEEIVSIKVVENAN